MVLGNYKSHSTPSAPNFLPHEEDSVSTLHTNDRNVMTTATNLQSLKQDTSMQPSAHFTPIVHDYRTVTSYSTDLTTETVQQLDSRITGLASQMIVHQNKNKQ